MPGAETQVGHYEILEEIGRGSMAIVHRARDPYENREAAVKTFLRPNGVSPERWAEFRRRLRRQVHRARRLTHPGIVRVFDFDDGGGSVPPFIAMEFVSGPTLHQLIRKEGALDPDWAVAVTDTLADALQAAHQAGVVHPHFEPGDVLVREADGVAKIADFGAVRVPDENGTEATRGTPSYLAPECVAGGPGELRSELYTLSVMLYEMLCGRPPFDAKTAGLTRESIVDHLHTPITERATDLAPAFDGFFERALAKRPEERFQDAPSFREALAAVREAQRAFRGEAATPATAAVEPPPAAEPAAPATAGVRAVASPRAGRAHSTLGRVLWWIVSAAVLVAFVLVVRWVWRADRFGGSTEARPSPVAARPRAEAPAPSARLAPAVASEEPVAPAPPAFEAPPKPQPKVVPSPKPARVAKAAPAVPVVPEPAPPAVEALAEPEPAPAPVVVQTARLDVSLKSSLRSGTLTLLVDGEEVYATPLESGDKKLVRAFKKAFGKAHQDSETGLEIPAGAHTITVQVVNEVKGEEYRESADIELAPGDARTLKIVTGRTLGRPLTIRVD